MTSADLTTLEYAVRRFAAEPHNVLIAFAVAFGVSPTGDNDAIARRLVDAGARPGRSFRVR